MKNRIIHAFAGTMILVSILLAAFFNINWLFLTGFVGINLLQSSMTNWCLLDKILTKIGVSNAGESCGV